MMQVLHTIYSYTDTNVILGKAQQSSNWNCKTWKKKRHTFPVMGHTSLVSCCWERERVWERATWASSHYDNLKGFLALDYYYSQKQMMHFILKQQNCVRDNFFNKMYFEQRKWNGSVGTKMPLLKKIHYKNKLCCMQTEIFTSFI